MEKSLHLNATHRAAWMACGFIVLAAATLTFSDSVNAAAVVVVENTRVQSPPVWYKTNKYYRGVPAYGYKGNAYRRSTPNWDGGYNQRGRR